jgi:hypothetical protein
VKQIKKKPPVLPIIERELVFAIFMLILYHKTGIKVNIWIKDSFKSNLRHNKI